MKNNKRSMFGASFWQMYVMTMRPYLLFISGAAGAVGLAFIERQELLRTIVAFMPLFLSYGFGQALTDCFQMDTDTLSSPYRPLVQGTISRKQVLGVSLVGLAAGVIILGYLNPMILILGTTAVVGLLTYTVFKRTWWGGPPWNSWIVALLPIIGRMSDRGYAIRTIFEFSNLRSLAFFFAILAVFFGYANFVVMGYFKDISADRQTGYRTFPVVFGWQAGAIYSDVLAVAAAVCMGCALFLVGRMNVPGVALFATAVVIGIHAQIRIHKTRDEQKTHGPIANVVRVFILYCSAMIITLKFHWFVFVILFYILFELVLKFRPEESQV